MNYFRLIITMAISILIVACTTINQKSENPKQSNNIVENSKESEHKSTNDSNSVEQNRQKNEVSNNKYTNGHLNQLNSDFATNKFTAADKINGAWNLKYESKSEQVTIILGGNTLKWQSSNLTVSFNVAINKNEISGSSNYNDNAKLKITLKLIDENNFSGVLESIANENGKEYIRTYNLIGTK